MLYVNCFPVGEAAIPISQILLKVGKQMQDQFGTRFYEMDAFKRRDSIAANMHAVLAIVAENGVDVVVDINSPDARVISEGLRPYARLVVEAIAR